MTRRSLFSLIVLATSFSCAPHAGVVDGERIPDVCGALAGYDVDFAAAWSDYLATGDQDRVNLAMREADAAWLPEEHWLGTLSLHEVGDHSTPIVGHVGYDFDVPHCASVEPLFDGTYVPGMSGSMFPI